MEIFHADEGINLEGKKAVKVLVRRMKQAIGEFHAINVMEQAWEGTKVHTQEGYNIGPIPYGYTAVKIPHPAPARRSRGLTKTRLAVDPVRGPVVTQIFTWRVIEKLTYWEIANKLNEDPQQYPPRTPTPNAKTAGPGVWTFNTVRIILANPKYTGHMVWNRSTTRTGATLHRKKTHRPNPVDQWVWSEEPTHPPLITLDRYRQAQKIGAGSQGSRTDTGANSHPATQRTYLYRGLLRCGLCGRRLQGTYQAGHVYYKCKGPRDAAGKATQPDHPGAVCVREDALTPAVANLIATRVFGPDRQKYLHKQHTAVPRQRAERHARAVEAARKTVNNLANRQTNLITELEETPQNNQTYRARIRQRYQELDQQRGEAETKLAELVATQPATDSGTPELLDRMPLARTNLAAVPATLQRRLFDALQLTIRIDTPRSAHVSITLTTDTPHTTAGTVAGIEPDTGDDPGTTNHPTHGTVANHPAIPAPRKSGDLLQSPMRWLADQSP